MGRDTSSGTIAARAGSAIAVPQARGEGQHQQRGRRQLAATGQQRQHGGHREHPALRQQQVAAAPVDDVGQVPAIGTSSTTGSVVAACTADTHSGEAVRSAITQAAATSCIHKADVAHQDRQPQPAEHRLAQRRPGAGRSRCSGTGRGHQKAKQLQPSAPQKAFASPTGGVAGARPWSCTRHAPP